MWVELGVCRVCFLGGGVEGYAGSGLVMVGLVVVMWGGNMAAQVLAFSRQPKAAHYPHSVTHLLCPPACLQGRGLATHAYTHSLETAHHMFMKLDNGKVRGGVCAHFFSFFSSFTEGRAHEGEGGLFNVCVSTDMHAGWVC